jgi:stearoyl-CoA desaturase (delta-9 desaturase)
MSHSLDALPDVAENHKPTLGSKLVTLAGVMLPFLGMLAAAVSLWGWACDWRTISLLLVMYLLTGLGITVGFHRHFTHQSFETSRIVQAIFGILGSMAMQGPLLRWVALHRLHHQHSDQAHDPHSPNTHGKGMLGVIRGLWHAHLGWLFSKNPSDLMHYVKDLRKSRLLRTISTLFPVWVAIGLLVPTLFGWLLIGGWMGMLLGLLWGGLARIFLVHHVTWSINSICHLWGQQPYQLRDDSRNNFIVGVLALGEGWHNNHHAFPTSARHGLRWWQIDVSYWVIWTLARMRLAWNVKQPKFQWIPIQTTQHGA